MKYENAQNVLPESLLVLLQQYVQGTCLYIPAANRLLSEKREPTLHKRQQEQRNQQIVMEYRSGIRVEDLAQRYYLSRQAIYKILKTVHR